MAHREQGFAGLRAKPQRGPHGGGEAPTTRPVRHYPPPPPVEPTRSSMVPIWLRGFGIGLVLCGLGLLALAVGADLPLP
ncbi:MAG: hypothetical protein M0R74_00830 [Dehalococcoidia bacterium]|nr:hypothetical protein [Dehalococcoidia bacterium]